MPTLTEQMLSQLGSDQAAALGARLGLDPGQTQAAVQVALPAILAAMASNAESKSGAKSLNDALDEDHDGSLLENLNEALSGGDTTDGQKILSHVFGDRRNAVAERAAQVGGVEPSAMQQLMGALAPVVMANLGKERRTNGLDAAQLSQRIGGSGGAAGLLEQVLGGALGGGRSSAGAGGGIAASILSRLGESQFQKLGAQVGLSPQQTRTLVQLALPLLLAALARNASRPEGAAALDNALASDHDGSLLERLSDFLGKGDVTPGDDILKHVLGGQRNTVEEGVGRAAGVDSKAVGSTLAMLAPLVLAELGRRKSEARLAPLELAAELRREREQYVPEASQVGTATPESSALGGLIGVLIDQDAEGDTTQQAAKVGRTLLGRLFGGGGEG